MKILLIVSAVVGLLLTAVFTLATLGFIQTVEMYGRLFREEER